MGYQCTRIGSSSQLAILTSNQRESIIRKERERRRLIRYQQVRQLSAENAAKIRERVKIAKQKELEELKKRITDATVQRNHLTSSGLLSPTDIDRNTLPTEKPRSSRRSQITHEELVRAVRRHYEALSKLRRENERERRRRELILERRRKAREVATVRSKRI
ncbi:Calpain-type cysteine protease [Dirofilaria immitis]